MPDASIVIRAPYGVSTDFIQGFANRKSGWIEKKQKYLTEKAQKHPPRKYIDGEKFYLTGIELTLRIQPGDRPEVWIDRGYLYLTPMCLSNPVKYLSLWYSAQAKNIIPGRVKTYAGLFGYEFKSIRINSAKTRWGSCGHKNSLNFSWRLVMAPVEIIDYVIVHELVHTEIKNHSKKFYKKLEGLMPGYRAREKWFKENRGFGEL